MQRLLFICLLAHQLISYSFAQNDAFNSQRITPTPQHFSTENNLRPAEALPKTGATAPSIINTLGKQEIQIDQLVQQFQLKESRYQQLLVLAITSAVALLIGLAVLIYRHSYHQRQVNQLLQTQRTQTQQAVSELKTMQEKLIQTEKMASLGKLAAGIAHEIQNPLNFVNNFSDLSADLIHELNEGPFHHLPKSEQIYASHLMDDLTKNLKRISHHGHRASSIVKGMLEQSRNSTREVQLTDLNALTDEYVRLAYQGQRANDKTFNCELVSQFDPHLRKVAIMPQEIGRVLLNLLSNAFYAVQDRQKQADAFYQPTVIVTTLQTKSGSEIRVHDNGTGIPETIQQRIFQPFFTTKPSGDGTGLGLSLVHSIITNDHHGSISVHSDPEHGTEFIILIPENKKL